MGATGIIAEYNPFHNGHRYQLDEVRRLYPQEPIVAVMSGSFMQRGEPAILDKWQRAELAVQGGCDLVLELPFLFAVRSAQDFARGGVALLQRLGIIDKIAFGAECSDLQLLQAAASLIDSPDCQAFIHSQAALGASYHKAIAAYLADNLHCDEAALSQPNNTLAIEYLRANMHDYTRQAQLSDESGNNASVAALESPSASLPGTRPVATFLQPLLIPRKNAPHNSLNACDGFASAGMIRQKLYSGGANDELWQNITPPATAEALRQLSVQPRPNLKALYRPLLCQLSASSLDTLRQYYGFNEELIHRLYTALSDCNSIDSLVVAASSRRYTQARIRRFLIWILLQVNSQTAADADTAGPLYIRPLAFNARGQQLLKSIKQQADIPVITKASSVINSRQLRGSRDKLSALQQQLAYDIIATDMAALCYPVAKPAGRDFLNSPRLIK